jgi:hypothetical protein
LKGVVSEEDWMRLGRWRDNTGIWNPGEEIEYDHEERKTIRHLQTSSIFKTIIG